MVGSTGQPVIEFSFLHKRVNPNTKSDHRLVNDGCDSKNKGQTVKTKKVGAAESKAKFRTIILAVIAVLIIGGIAGVAIYIDRVAPFRTTVLVVGDRSINMRYFLKRVRISGREPMALFQTLIREEIIKQVAPNPPYNIDISEEETDQFLKGIARGESDTISENDFKEWYRQQLNETRLSKAEFRDLARTNLLTLRLTEYLTEKVPTVAEQIHLHMIPVQEFEVVNKIKERLDAGADFATLAREVSSDPKLKERGGDFGWFPRGALSPEIARAAFDELDVNEASEPLYLDDRTFVVIMISEKTAAREIDDEPLQMIKVRALDEWLKEENQYHKVEFHGFKNGYDSETDAWVQWQLQRMKR